MRKMVLALTAFAAASALAAGQPPADPKAAKQLRTYGVVTRLRAFPQDTPQAAVRSVITAIEKGEIDYLVAHLMEPAFVDARVEDRRQQLLGVVEDDLKRLRAQQQQAPERYDVSVRVPVDVTLFKEKVADESKRRAFAQVVRDVTDKLADDPQALRDLRRFARDGVFPAAGMGTTAKVTIPDVRDRAVFLKKVDDRWFLENRQTEAAEPKEPEKKEPPKKGPEKKEP
jgi:hypothetical protein